MMSAVWIGGQGKGIGKLLRLFHRLLHAFSIAPEAPGHSEDSIPATQAAESLEAPGAGPEIGVLYRKYAASIYWVCMKYVRNKEDAEDMVNQVFIKVQQNLAGFKGQSRIYSWIYRIAVNECIQLFRKRKFEVDGAGVADFEEMLHASPEEQMDACLLVERITREADRETVEIVFLLYLEGLTQEEVVEKLGISRTTIHRKVTAFKARMERYR